MGDIATDEVERRGLAAKAASRTMATAPSTKKNDALRAMYALIIDNQQSIIDENRADLERADANGLTKPMIDRLTLTPNRIADMAAGILEIASLPDPIGAVLGGVKRPNGLQITKLRVPLGVIGIIFESRPNVTVDAASLCVKSGNCVILRGGSEAIRTNIVLADLLRRGLRESGLPDDAIQLIHSTERSAAHRMMTLNGMIDCLIPRGGSHLIKMVTETATVPVIETGTGNCHIFVDKDADLEMALQIILNAKTSRPSVCNSVETVLIHEDVVEVFAPLMAAQLVHAHVEIRSDEKTARYLSQSVPATEQDWYEEYNALILAVKTVEDCADAIEHISKYGTKHSEAIITTNYNMAQEFCDQVDAAAVYVNASTRFTDGHRFGMGAEIGISNQKLHARGPMGLEELTTYKYVVRGTGQVV